MRYFDRNYFINNQEKYRRYRMQHLVLVDCMKVFNMYEFMATFPLIKDYAGEKSLCIDYLYSMQSIKEICKDFYSPIGENIYDLLVEYHNWKIRFFVVNGVTLINTENYLDCRPSMMEDLGFIKAEKKGFTLDEIMNDLY